MLHNIEQSPKSTNSLISLLRDKKGKTAFFEIANENYLDENRRYIWRPISALQGNEHRHQSFEL